MKLYWKIYISIKQKGKQVQRWLWSIIAHSCVNDKFKAVYANIILINIKF